MTSYRELYFHLFNALTDAILDLEAGRVVPAIQTMKQAQQEAEEAHLRSDILPEG